MQDPEYQAEITTNWHAGTARLHRGSTLWVPLWSRPLNEISRQFTSMSSRSATATLVISGIFTELRGLVRIVGTIGFGAF